MRRLQKILHYCQRVGAAIVQLIQIGERFGEFAAHQLLEQIEDASAVGEAEHRAHHLRRDRAFFAVRNGLIEQRQRVARRALGRACNQRQRRILDLHVLFFGDRFQQSG